MIVSDNKKPIYTFLLLLVGLLAFVGCDDEGEGYRKSKGTSLGAPSLEARAQIKKKGTGLVEKESDNKESTDIELPRISETDFIEDLSRRDPYRPYVEVLLQQEVVQTSIQREIKLKDFDVSELRLIAIVTNIGDPRAMVVTPSNDGIVLRRGDYVGKADYIDQGIGSEKVQINWKVARIHGSGKEEDRGLYLVRDDPQTPTADDIKRFMPLHPRSN